MKTNLLNILLGLFTLGIILTLSPGNVLAQNKARLSLDYQKIMGENGQLLINAKFKVEKKYQPAQNLELNVYQIYGEDSMVLEGQAMTNSEGDANFENKNTRTAFSDSNIKTNYIVKIENNDDFRDANKKLSFLDAFLRTEIIEEDSLLFVSAELLNGTGEAIEGEDIEIKVQRLFAPLQIGEKSYETNDEGKIMVEIENPIYSNDGNITYEIVLDSKKYGVVKSIFNSPTGTIREDVSSFDERTMWSPPGKTPWFLLIASNLLIIGIWSIILLLLINLFKIHKS